MTPVDSRRFTLADFRTIPEVSPSLEYFGRRVIQKMSPKLPDSVIQIELGATFVNWNRQTKQARAFSELRCTFGGASHVFDLCVFAARRISKFSDLGERDDVLAPPDLAIEILSPGQTVGELARKLRSAIRRGVRLGWLIDQARRRVFVLRPGVRSLVLGPGQTLTGEPALPGFLLPIDEVFGWLADY